MLVVAGVVLPRTGPAWLVAGTFSSFATAIATASLAVALLAVALVTTLSRNMGQTDEHNDKQTTTSMRCTWEFSFPVGSLSSCCFFFAAACKQSNAQRLARQQAKMHSPRSYRIHPGRPLEARCSSFAPPPRRQKCRRWHKPGGPTPYGTRRRK